MRLAESLNRLDFKNKAVFDQNIYLEGNLEKLTIKDDRNRYLPRNLEATCIKSACENRLIYAFKQARSQLAMNTDCLLNDDPAYLIATHRPPLRPPFLCGLCANQI